MALRGSKPKSVAALVTYASLRSRPAVSRLRGVPWRDRCPCQAARELRRFNGMAMPFRDQRDAGRDLAQKLTRFCSPEKKPKLSIEPNGFIALVRDTEGIGLHSTK